MNLLLSDFPLTEELPKCDQNCYVDLNQMKIAGCKGCFGCWVKTPGKCVLRDDAVKIYPLIAKSERLIYVSRLFYGSYDEPMKYMLERAIPIQQAFIRLYHNETHHVQRQVVKKQAVIIAYGEKDEQEREIFRKLVGRNAKNMQFTDWKIHFSPEKEVEKAIRREVGLWESF
ncbi:flavodoxin family protein [Mediterraneibacter sp. NSJ-55]|uniref:Flavodoxin family protein n=1 Tax=Mediterraneibacter hominis TaxID=2763054 RepID=A0A923RR42_9FIRM|nr:NAD(P)H-dependent oxidoreductase [Mediterraneibacter hominis]MBC5689298.1 flavodoxin family protein [Mediterraneibacter hominis]